MTTTYLSEDILDKYSDFEVPWGFNGLGEIVYKRTYSRPVEGTERKEEWLETILRVLNGAQDIDAGYTLKELERLFGYMANLKGTFSGRALWQLGTSMVQKFGGTSLVNCWYVSLEDIVGFEFLMDHLMLGGGVGYSVERGQIYSLPKVLSDVEISHQRTNDADMIVPDSRNGWSRLLHSVLKSFFYTGKSFTYSTILVRSYGAPLKTFGGTASGPEVLVDGIQDICAILKSREGKRLRSVDALDIANIIGAIVIAGSARRSAQIALGDPDDFLYLRAKNWGTGKIPAWRANSNNSILADSYDEIIDQFWKNYDGSSEPYGLVNRKLMRTQGRLGERVNDSKIMGTNPCSEIGLEDGEPCNLAEIFLPNVSSKKEFIDLAKLLYKTQKAITTLWYPYEKTREVIARNRRLGLGITGWLQATPEQLSWVPEVYKELKAFDEKWSIERGLTTSIKLTTCKPSGTLSLLAGVTPGGHPGFSRFHIRRVRFGSNDPLVDQCRERGYNVQYDIGIDGKEDHTKFVVDFPCSFPEGTVLKRDITAIEQLEWVVKIQSEWADNAVSVTVYYNQDELEDIKQWLEKNYEKKIKSVSFLPYEEHGFTLPPLEEIDEKTYNKLISKINTSTHIEDLNTVDVIDLECEGGACPIR